MRQLDRTARLTLGLAVVALGLLGCAVALSDRNLVGPTVVAAAARPAATAIQSVGGPRLPHAKHLESGIECADCHEPGNGGEPGYPSLEFCMDCHEDMEEDEEVPVEKRVASVFFTPDQKPKWVRAIRAYEPGIAFSHAKHAKAACKDCHSNLEQKPRRAAHLFTMDGCTSCHTRMGGTQLCVKCHAAYRDDVEPPDHLVADFETRHGQMVRDAQERGEDPTCHYCHKDPNYCNECHFTVLPTSHAVGFEQEHGRLVLAAGGPGEARCTYCHVDQAFCDDCHMNVMPSSHRHMWTRRHGAMVRTQGASLSARCKFCHDAPSFCEDCHRIEEPRDHTTLFRTRTHGLVASVDRTRCRVCHQTDFCVRCHEYTAPRTHRGQWARGRNTHCATCHLPVGGSCAVCHKARPVHATAPPIPPGHIPGSDCRTCHTPTGTPGVPPLRHVDPGLACQLCHQ